MDCHVFEPFQTHTIVESSVGTIHFDYTCFEIAVLNGKKNKKKAEVTANNISD